jgi:hypothetical protein
MHGQQNIKKEISVFHNPCVLSAQPHDEFEQNLVGVPNKTFVFVFIYLLDLHATHS